MAVSAPSRWRRRVRPALVLVVAGVAAALWRDRKLTENARRYDLPG
ncbi:MAG: hypothetical protein ABIS47_05155 [Acidimicrobiales bacterium]